MLTSATLLPEKSKLALCPARRQASCRIKQSTGRLHFKFSETPVLRGTPKKKNSHETLTFVLSNPSSLQDCFPSFPLLLPIIPISALGTAARRLLSLDVAILPSDKNQTLITRVLKARHPGLLKRFSTSGSACKAAEEPQARAQGSPGNQSPRFPP